MWTFYWPVRLRSVCRGFLHRYLIYAIWRITLLLKFEPWSVIQAFGAVYGILINFSTSASAILDDVICFSGTATEYLVSRSWIVSMYLYPLLVVGSGPTISIETLSNAVPCVSVKTMACWDLHGLTFLIDNFDILYKFLYFRFHSWPKLIMANFFIRLRYTFMASDGRSIIFEYYFISIGWLGNSYTVVAYNYSSVRIIKQFL